jgi:hypothetical protein
MPVAATMDDAPAHRVGLEVCSKAPPLAIRADLAEFRVGGTVGCV